MKTLRGYFFIVLLLILAMSCDLLTNSSPNTPDASTDETSSTPEQNQPVTTSKSLSFEFVSLWNVEGGPNETGQISHFTMDPDGNLVFVGAGKSLQHPSVSKFDIQGKFLTQWGEQGGGEGKFGAPTNVAVDGQGNIYVTDSYNFPDQLPIQKFDKDGKFLASFGSFDGDNALEWPGGIAVDSSGNVFVTDMSNKISKYDASGNFVISWSALAQEGDRGQYFDLAIDSEDNLYMLNIEDHGHLIKFDANGVDLMSWPQILCGTDYFSVDNQGGVWIDQQGLIYITNSYSNGICVLDKDGNFVGSSKLEDAQEGQYNEPVDVVGDNAGNIYVLESRNDGYRVQVFKVK